ncbi:MAG: hypothetical protein AAF125_04975 [Chloroflexota bacterium]
MRVAVRAGSLIIVALLLLITLALSAPPLHSPHTLIDDTDGRRFDVRNRLTHYPQQLALSEDVYVTPDGRYAVRVGSTRVRGELGMRDSAGFAVIDQRTGRAIGVTPDDIYLDVNAFTWAPDGVTLWFRAITDEGNGVFRSILVALDTSATQPILREVMDLTARVGSVFIVAYAPGGERLALWSGQQRLHIVNINTGEELGRQRIPAIGEVEWINDDVLVYEQGRCLYHLAAATMTITEFNCPSVDAVYALALSPDGERLAVAWTAPTPRTDVLTRLGISTFDLATGVRTDVFASDTRSTVLSFNPLQWAADGRYLLASYSTNSLISVRYVIDTVTPSSSASFRLPLERYNARWETKGQIDYAR